jgi:RNA polymerase sigma factor (sigma-70 family)
MHTMNNNDLYTQFLPFAKSTAAKFCAMPSVASQMDADDMVQELMIRLLDKISEFDPDKGMKLSTYGCQIIRWRAGEIHKACKAAVEQGKGYMPSLDQMHDDNGSAGGRDDTWHPEVYDDASFEFLEGLCDRDRDIILRHTVYGESLRSIGEDYGVSGEAIRLWHKAALAQVSQGL